MELQGLFFTEDHVWVWIDGDQASLGITDHGQKALGAIVFAELPAEGDMIERGRAFGLVESYKSVFELPSPVGGTVLKSNSAVVRDPSLLNTKPLENWLVRLACTDIDGIATLMDAAEYEKSTK